MKAKIRIKSSDEITTKGNGRIFVQNEEDIEIVRSIIKEMDEQEYEHYLPKDFIAVFHKDRNPLTYTGKFDIDVPELIIRCQEKDIYIVVYSCNSYNYDDTLTLERALENNMHVSDFVYNKTKNW